MNCVWVDNKTCIITSKFSYNYICTNNVNLIQWDRCVQNLKVVILKILKMKKDQPNETNLPLGWPLFITWRSQQKINELKKGSFIQNQTLNLNVWIN